MIRVRVMSVVMVLTVTVVACGNSGGGSSSPETTSSTAATMSVQQVASQVSRTAEDAIDNLKTARTCLVWTLCSVAERITYLTVSIEAETLQLTLSNMTPPAEVAGLVKSTLSAARKVVDTHGAFTAAQCGGSTLTDRCSQLNDSFQFAMTELAGELEAWGPYL